MDPWRGRGWREGLGTILLLSQPRGTLGSSTAKWKSKPTKPRPQTFEALPRRPGMIATLTLLQPGLPCLPAWRSQPERSQSMTSHLPRAVTPSPPGAAPLSPPRAAAPPSGEDTPTSPGQCPLISQGSAPQCPPPPSGVVPSPPPWGSDPLISRGMPPTFWGRPPTPLQGSAPPPSQAEAPPHLSFQLGTSCSAPV